MSTFNPDKPFEVVESSPTGFDPNQPFEQVEEPSIMESGLRGGVQGLSLGFSDELTALAESMLTPKTYEQSVAESRANYKAAEEANPKSYLAGELIGGVATTAIPVVGQLGTAAKGAVGLAKIGQIAAGSAGIGALSGLGYAEGDIKEQVVETLKGGALGAVAGSMLYGAGKAVSKLTDVSMDAVKPYLNRDESIVRAITPKSDDLRDSLGGIVTHSDITEALKGSSIDSVNGLKKVVSDRLEKLTSDSYPSKIKSMASSEAGDDIIDSVAIAATGVGDTFLQRESPNILISQVKRINSIDADIMASVDKAMSQEFNVDKAKSLYAIKRQLDEKVRKESDGVIKSYLQEVSELGFSKPFGFEDMNREYRTLRAIESRLDDVKQSDLAKIKQSEITPARIATAVAGEITGVGGLKLLLAKEGFSWIGSSNAQLLISNLSEKVGADKTYRLLLNIGDKVKSIVNSRLSEAVKNGLLIKLSEEY